MPLKPFKFIVQAVVLHEDEDGNPIGEATSEQPNILYGVDALRDFADGFEEQLAQQELLLGAQELT